jgi:uncharacterized protein (DUF4415 family)
MSMSDPDHEALIANLRFRATYTADRHDLALYQRAADALVSERAARVAAEERAHQLPEQIALRIDDARIDHSKAPSYVYDERLKAFNYGMAEAARMVRSFAAPVVPVEPPENPIRPGTIRT